MKKKYLCIFFFFFENMCVHINANIYVTLKEIIIFSLLYLNEIETQAYIKKDNLIFSVKSLPKKLRENAKFAYEMYDGTPYGCRL